LMFRLKWGVIGWEWGSCKKKCIQMKQGFCVLDVREMDTNNDYRVPEQRWSDCRLTP
jgi:hypothetical protein